MGSGMNDLTAAALMRAMGHCAGAVRVATDVDITSASCLPDVSAYRRWRDAVAPAARTEFRKIVGQAYVRRRTV